MADQRVVVASTITLGRELIESTSLVSTSRGFESSTKIKTLTSRSKVKKTVLNHLISWHRGDGDWIDDDFSSFNSQLKSFSYGATINSKGSTRDGKILVG